MRLSIVIPSRNPEALFLCRVAALCADQPDWQVIVVDDASDIDLQTLLPQAGNLIVHRNARQVGAGAARNVGLKAVRGIYTVFLDDDDVMDWNVVTNLMASMDAQPDIDMVVSSYRFLRDGRIQPPHASDQRIIDAILRGQDRRVVELDGHEDLLRVTNFPWTKLYRSDFIRRIGLRFSDTVVQNDVLAHWHSLLQATRVMVTGSIQCTQTFDTRSGRINGITDDRRLQAYDALRETYDLVQAKGQPQVELTFWRFYHDLVRWMMDRSAPAQRPALMRQHVRFAGMMPPDVSAAGAGFRQWEIWDMTHLTDRVSEMTSAWDAVQQDICLTEMSRLKHLAVALRADNDRLNGELRQRQVALEAARKESAQRDLRMADMDAQIVKLQRHVNSKAAQMAFRLRKIYRSILPPRGPRR
ncbi:Glycosyl transferase family 2 [Loktanella fryxellensis]|uniref:Glycosyl transferase family 2 n=2 Tax=Loktanella fryxellensis TaxID=245187 RepID=A0A1H8GUB2_9RHOB|nr:Glycosyl transferase family 2 [Loktanella fryxellensis]